MGSDDNLNQPTVRALAILNGVSTVSSASSLTATAVVTHVAASSPKAKSTMTATAVVTHVAAANLFVKSAITATGKQGKKASASLSAKPKLTANGFVIQGNPISGGVKGGGVAVISSPIVHLQASGGVDTGGSAKVRIGVTAGVQGGGVVVDGTAKFKIGFRYRADGGVTVGSDSRSSGVNLSLTKSYEFAWRTNQAATATYEFAWSTGQQRSYFFRVVGKGKTDICDPLQADECCKKFVVNVQARTVDDVCRKLREMIGVWPIEKIQRFSRPAERAAIAEDEANGIDHTCNKAEDVDFCKIPICADFCVEYDLRETWGGYSILEYTNVSAMGVQSLTISRKHRHVATGGIFLGGQCQSRTSRELRFAPIAKVGRIGGGASYRSTNYRHIAQGGLTLSGNAGSKTERWKFKGGQWPLISEFMEPTLANAEGWTQGDDGSFSFPLESGPSTMLMLAGLDHDAPEGGKLVGVMVEIDRFANGLVQDAEVVLFRGGNQSRNLARDYNWPLALPVAANYGSGVDDWGVEGDGPLAIGIRVRPVATRPGLLATIRFVRVRFAYDQGGGRLALSGTSGVRVSHHRYRGQGKVRIGGGAKVRLVEYSPPAPLSAEPIRALAYVPPAPSKGMPLLVRALSTTTATTTITSIGQDVVPELEQLGLTVAKCGCFNMPLAIPFAHNLANVNKLSEFVKRNGQSIPKFVTLQYNKTNESWQANLRYSGPSAVASGLEMWNVLFELQCTDILSGTQIGQGVWRFGLRVTQRNLATGQDYDTRVMAAFLPDPICSKGKEFRVKLTFDTLLGVASTNPNATIYEVVVHDNIGLFKSSAWMDNPKLLIDMSQVGLPPTQPRITLNIGT